VIRIIINTVIGQNGKVNAEGRILAPNSYILVLELCPEQLMSTPNQPEKVAIMIKGVVLASRLEFTLLVLNMFGLDSSYALQNSNSIFAYI